MHSSPLKNDQDQAIEYALDIVSLSKIFIRTTRRASYTTFKSAILNLFKRSRDKTTRLTTEAISELTIRIPKGSSVGIIGRNGSGKSTLLKLISGIYQPTSGTISVNGRVSALIELGAGFHPDFTGRENLYLGGIIHGLTRREVSQRFDQIVGFAELADVIDDPVRTYSSGMFMRLGFSLAVHTNPDLLLVDEVLAVGDAGFVAKCKDRLRQLRRDGTTMFLVSHDLDAIEQFSDEVVWLDRGKVRDRGHPRRVIDHYREFVEHGEEAAIFETEKQPSEAKSQPREPERWGSREVEVTGVRLIVGTEERRVLHPDDAIRVEIDYRINQSGVEPLFGVGIDRADGINVFGTNTEIDGVKLPPLGESGTLSFSVDRIGILDGAYTLSVAAHRSDGYAYDYQQHAISFSVRSASKRVGLVSPHASWSVEVTTPSRRQVNG